jgi:sorbitol/mannitol transport system permease protein
MARKTTAAQMATSTVIAWAVGLIMFFPILWTAMAAFKTETDAYSLPENWWSTPWTTENFGIVQDRSNYLRYVLNTTIIAVASTLLGLVFAIPAAWSMAFQPEDRASVSWPGYVWVVIVLGGFAAAGAIAYSVGWRMADRPLLGLALILLFGLPLAAWIWTRRTGDKLLWMLSTKMMPPAGALIPIYLIFNRNGLIFKDWGWVDLSDWNLIDTFAGMIPLMMLLNLPIVVWMLYTYFKEIPFGILEAARMDGAGLWQELANVLAPMAVPGIASTLLLNVILSWNEAFWTLNLTNKYAAPLSFFISEYSSPEGQFWAKLSAASLMAIAPIMVLGWFSQRQLVRGLTFGAVK